MFHVVQHDNCYNLRWFVEILDVLSRNILIHIILVLHLHSDWFVFFLLSNHDPLPLSEAAHVCTVFSLMLTFALRFGRAWCPSSVFCLGKQERRLHAWQSGRGVRLAACWAAGGDREKGLIQNVGRVQLYYVVKSVSVWLTSVFCNHSVSYW